MDRLDAMRVFVAVAEAEGFAPAARRLSLSPPQVTRAVAALEARIGALLLHRTTRIVRLTDAGTRFLADCRRILGEVEQAEAAAAGSHGELRGPLAVTAPILFGRLHVAPVLLDFLARHPAVTARAMLADRVVDIIEEGMDVAVRIAHLPDSSLTAIKVGSVRRVVCASRHYLAARGTPRRPSDVLKHDVVAFWGQAAAPEWAFGAGGRGEVIRPAARMTVNTAEVAIAAAVAGHGLTRVLSYQAATDAAAGRLRIVLREFEPEPIPVYIVHAEGGRASARVRAFVDFAVEQLRADPALR